MKQIEFINYTIAILNIYKRKYPQYHCKETYCCGLCDKFYPCLFDLLEKIKQQAILQREKNENSN